jgi:hypothetical protein
MGMSHPGPFRSHPGAALRARPPDGAASARDPAAKQIDEARQALPETLERQQRARRTLEARRRPDILALLDGASSSSSCSTRAPRPAGHRRLSARPHRQRHGKSFAPKGDQTLFPTASSRAICPVS